jgi:ParB family transcriptional regulator, chromosome partitioning protein
MKLNLNAVASESKARYSKELTGLKELEKTGEILEKLRGLVNKTVDVPIGWLTPGENVRQATIEEEADFERLVNSISTQGLNQNIVARLIELEDGKWQLRINAGERRYRACKEVGLEKVSVKIKPWVSELEELYTGIDENENRVNLSPLDLGDAYSRAVKLGASVEEIAERSRRDKRTIRKYIHLSTLPPDARKIILDHQDILSTRILFNEVASRKFDSEEELRNHIQSLIEERSRASTLSIESEESIENVQGTDRNVTAQGRRIKPVDPDLMDEVISRISGNVPVKVKVKGTREKGRITINYNSREQLEKFLARFQI